MPLDQVGEAGKSVLPSGDGRGHPVPARAALEFKDGVHRRCGGRVHALMIGVEFAARSACPREAWSSIQDRVIVAGSADLYRRRGNSQSADSGQKRPNGCALGISRCILQGFARQIQDLLGGAAKTTEIDRLFFDVS